MYTCPVVPSAPVFPSQTRTIWAALFAAFAGGRCLMICGFEGWVTSTISVPSFSQTPPFNGSGSDPVQPPPPDAACRPANKIRRFANALPVLLGYLCTVG